MDPTQNFEASSLRRIAQERLSEIELFPSGLPACGHVAALGRGRGLVEFERILGVTHSILILIGMPDNNDRMPAVVKKYGALALSGIQRFHRARVQAFENKLPDGRPYLIDAIDVASLDVFDLMESTYGLRGPNLGLMEVVCVPKEFLKSGREALHTTVEAMNSIARCWVELTSGSLEESWQDAINQFATTTYEAFDSTILKLKNQLTEEQFVLLLAGPGLQQLMPPCEEYAGRLDNLIVSP